MKKIFPLTTLQRPFLIGCRFPKLFLYVLKFKMVYHDCFTISDANQGPAVELTDGNDSIKHVQHVYRKSKKESSYSSSF